MLTDCPSPTHSCLGLGPTNPMWTDLASETLGIRRSRFSRDLRYSYRHSHFRSLHRSFRYGFDAPRTLPYCIPPFSGIPVSSVTCLAPLYFPRKTVRPVSYYALFKGWLLLSSPPSCLRLQTPFVITLNRNLGTLIIGWVAFPDGPQDYPRGPHSRLLRWLQVRSSTGDRKLSFPKPPIGALPHNLPPSRSNCD
jgi:hypothetical protein